MRERSATSKARQRLAWLLLALTAGPEAVRSACVPSGSEQAINELFRRGGSATTVALCPGSIHRIQSPIVFTASSQVLTTDGDPTDRMRAMIVVEGKNQAMAIKADCDNCDFAEIRSLIVDGNRPELLRVPKGDALVELGNALHQSVRDCRLYEPRGWSALHFREGNRKQCRFGKIQNNEIGPAGEEWDDEYDGLVELSPPYGNPRADGISLACKDSLVENNTVFDCTDGAIVIFGSAGSEVRQNTIYSRSRVILGGINLVDYEPWEGDYSRVTVHHNDIAALGSYLKVAINVGPATWSDDTETEVHSGKVYENTLSGDHMGYGIVVASAREFTVVDNKSTARFSGVMGDRCPKAPPNREPTAFLINRGSADGTYQKDFINGEVQHVICIEPETADGSKYKPRRLRDSPAAAAAKAAENLSEERDQAKMDSVDATVAENLVAYQMQLMQAMDVVATKVRAMDSGSGKEAGEARSVRKGSSGSVLEDMAARLASMETDAQQAKNQADSLKDELRRLTSRLRSHERERNSLLSSLQQLAHGLYSSDGAHSPNWSAATSVWTPAVSFVMIQVAIVILVWAFRCLGRDKVGRRRALSLGGSRREKGKIF